MNVAVNMATVLDIVYSLYIFIKWPNSIAIFIPDEGNINSYRNILLVEKKNRAADNIQNNSHAERTFFVRVYWGRTSDYLQLQKYTKNVPSNLDIAPLC
jgi:hypothetical protein